MTIARWKILLVGLSLPVAGAAAQDDEQFSYHYNAKESERTLEDFARCLVNERGGQQRAEHFVRQIPDTAASTEAGKALIKPACLRGGFGRLKLQMKSVTLRRAMFVALYRRKFGYSEPTGLAEAPPLLAAHVFDGGVEALPARTLAELTLGACVARADTPAAHRFVMAKPWSPAEETVLPGVTRAIAGCLPDRGKLRLARGSARGVIAEGLYDLSVARGEAFAQTQPAMDKR